MTVNKELLVEALLFIQNQIEEQSWSDEDSQRISRFSRMSIAEIIAEEKSITPPAHSFVGWVKPPEPRQIIDSKSSQGCQDCKELFPHFEHTVYEIIAEEEAQLLLEVSEEIDDE